MNILKPIADIFKGMTDVIKQDQQVRFGKEQLKWNNRAQFNDRFANDGQAAKNEQMMIYVLAGVLLVMVVAVVAKNQK